MEYKVTKHWAGGWQIVQVGGWNYGFYIHSDKEVCDLVCAEWNQGQ